MPRPSERLRRPSAPRTWSRRLRPGAAGLEKGHRPARPERRRRHELRRPRHGAKQRKAPASPGLIRAPQPPTVLDRLDGLVEQTQGLIRRGETFIRDLTGETGPTLSYRSAFKEDLLRIIEELEEVAATVGALDPYLAPDDASIAASGVRDVIEVWAGINEAIDQAVSRVVRGQADRSFQLLSPIANAENLRGRRRLVRLHEGLEELASRGRPAPHEPAPAETPAPAPAEAEQEIDVADQALVEEEDVDLLLERAVPLPEEELNYTGVFSDDEAETDEQTPFEECLERLDSPHELDRNDALIDMIRTHQHQLVAHLIRGTAQEDPMLERLLESLWQNAEIVLLDDYFFSVRRSKLTKFIELADPYPQAERFRRLLRLFRPGPHGFPTAEDAILPIEADEPGHYKIFLRALLLHPLEEYRRYAAANLDPSDYWSLISFPQAPLHVLATVLDQVAEPGTPEDYRKVFFDCTLKTLAKARGEEAIKAVRRILNLLFSFDFFVEDDYFKKILRLNQLVEHEETRLGRQNALFKESMRLLKAQKAKVGARNTKAPDFAGIPLTVQRKLARDGMYTQLFACHPDAKIALETLPFVNNPDRVAQVVRLSTINALLLSELAKRDDLFRTRAARMSLLANPKTPLRTVYGYIPLMAGTDLRKLAVSKDINPEIAVYLKRILQRKGMRLR